MKTTLEWIGFLVVVSAGLCGIAALWTLMLSDWWRERKRGIEIAMSQWENHGKVRWVRYRLGLKLLRPYLGARWMHYGLIIKNDSDIQKAMQALRTDATEAEVREQRIGWDRHNRLEMWRMELLQVNQLSKNWNDDAQPVGDGDTDDDVDPWMN